MSTTCLGSSLGMHGTENMASLKSTESAYVLIYTTNSLGLILWQVRDNTTRDSKVSRISKFYTTQRDDGNMMMVFKITKKD